jgi:hypothetical protein
VPSEPVRTSALDAALDDLTPPKQTLLDAEPSLNGINPEQGRAAIGIG